jgi:hypothetical protein
VSFLGELLVLGTERGTRAAHGPKEGLPSPALAAARASVPSGAAAWIAVDASGLRGGDGGAAAMAQGLKSLTAWGLFGETLDLRALAKAADGKQAVQLAGLASMLAGIAASTAEGKALAGIDIKPSGDTVQASLSLTAAQIRELSKPAPATAPPDRAKPASGT